MKALYMIGGTMGVGKTTTSRALVELCDDVAFLDGDWCWDLHPFRVTEETKRMVMDNICFILNGFLHATQCHTIVFCWVMHDQSIIDEICSHLDLADCAVRPVSLTCSEHALRARLERDVAAGLRSPEVIARSLARLRLYADLDTTLIDTTGKTPEQVAQEVLS